MVQEFVVAFKPGTRSLVADLPEARRSPCERGYESGSEQQQQAEMQPVGKAQQDIEQGQCYECTENAGGWP